MLNDMPVTRRIGLKAFLQHSKTIALPGEAVLLDKGERLIMRI